MARLPNPGSDNGVWGDILNDYLSQVHNADGTLKSGAADSDVIQDGTITAAKLASAAAVDGQVLVQDSAAAGGLAWVTPVTVPALGARTGRPPELYTSFVNKPDNASYPTTFDTGQTASEVNWGTATTMSVSDGALTQLPADNNTAAGYYVGQLTGTVTRIGQRFKFKPNPSGAPTTGGAVAMAICRTAIAGTTIPTMSVHFEISPASVGIGIWNGADEPGTDGLTLLGGNNFTNSLKVDDQTEYEMEAWVEGTKVTFEVREGDGLIIYRGTYTDSRVGTYGGPWVFFEAWANNGATDQYSKITHVWASSGVNHPPAPRFQSWRFGKNAGTLSNLVLPAASTVPLMSPSYTPLVLVPPSGKIKCGMSASFGVGSVGTSILFQYQITPLGGATIYPADYALYQASTTGVKRLEQSQVIEGLTPGLMHAVQGNVFSTASDTTLYRNAAGAFNASFFVEPVE